MNNRNKIVLIVIALVSLSLLMLGTSSIYSRATVLNSKLLRQETIEERKTFSESRPEGKWSVGAVPDKRQAEDTVTPVIVGGLSSSFGKGKYAGFLKVLTVRLFNRSPKSVMAVRLGWRIVPADVQGVPATDHEVGLVEGSTPLFEAHIPANGSTRRIDSPAINFMKEVRPLINVSST